MSGADWAVLVLYAVAVVGLGTWAGRRERDADDFFLAGRSLSWVPVAVSSLATALSALTFIGVPGAAFGGNFVYFQLQFGTLAGSILLARIFLPLFYRLRVTTVYELLGDRFGPRSRVAATLFFLVSRVLGSGVRLAGCAIAVSVFFGLGLRTSIVLIALCAALYTMTGGIKAVIWTDILQFSLFMAGAVVAIAVVWSRLPGGFEQFLEIGRAHSKFDAFNFSFDLSDPTTFWAGNFFAAVVGLAVGATDQDIAQRSLTCRDVGQAQKAAVAYGAAGFATTLIFLTVGASLFAFYQVFPDPGVTALVGEKRFDRIFPYFILHGMPAGLRGILVAALLAAAMSSLDSALNGLASCVYVDLYKPVFGAGDDGARAVRISRILVAAFAVILAATAAMFGRKPSILWFGLRIMGYTYGGLLGVFLLAALTRRRGAEAGNIFAMATSVFVVLFFTTELPGASLGAFREVLLAPLGVDKIAWPWAIVIGTAWTFALGAAWPPDGKKTG